MAKLPLTNAEKRYFDEMKKMEQEKLPFTHGGMCTRLEYRSTARSFQLMTALIAKGWVQHGTRLAVVECPVTIARAA